MGHGSLPYLRTRRSIPLRIAIGAVGGLGLLCTPGGPHSCSDNPGLFSSTPFRGWGIGGDRSFDLGHVFKVGGPGLISQSRDEALDSGYSH